MSRVFTLRLTMTFALISAFLIQSVSAQILFPKRKTRPAGTTGNSKPLKEAPPTGTNDAELLKKTLQRLEEVEKEIARFKGLPYKPIDRKGKIFAIVDSPGMNQVYLGNNKRTRVLGARLTLINMTDKDFEIPSNTLELDETGKTHKSGNVPDQIKGYSVPVGENYKSVRDLIPPEKIKVPSQGLATTWFMFHGLDGGSHIPKLALKTTINGKQYSWDLNEAARAEMKLEIQRIGPHECLGFCKIEGDTNILSIGSLIDELDVLAAKGVSRVVIAWTDEAKPLSSQFSSNMLQAVVRMGQENRFGRNDQFPDFPSSIREFHIAMSKKVNKHNSYYYNSSDSRNRIHEKIEDGIGAALKSAFEVLGHDDLIEQIESGNPHIKAAALAFGGKTLTPDDLPLILAMTGESDVRIQKAAIICLSEFSEPAAIEKLRVLCEHKNKDLAEAAITSLIISRFPLARESIREILKGDQEQLRQQVLQLMAKYPRAIWSDDIYEFAKTGDVNIRSQAMRALNTIGHPDLVSLLKNSMREENTQINSTAFSLLMGRTDAESESIVLDYTLEKIEKEKPTSQMLSFLSRVRDKRALPYLTKYLNDEKSSRSSLIGCIASIGDASTLQLLYDSYSKMKNSSEKQAILTALLQQDIDMFRKLAKTAIKEKYDSSTTRTICNGLQQDATDEAVTILSDEMKRMMSDKKVENTSKASRITSALGVIATPEAKSVLRYVRDNAKNTSFKSYANNAIRNTYSRSAAYSPLYYAKNSVKAKQWDKAVKQFSVALEIDSEIPEAYSGRAECYFQLAKYDEAMKDYDKAIKLEPNDAEIHNKRGHVFTRQRKFAEAIPDFEKAIKLSPKTAKYYLSRGNAFWMQEKFDLAKPDFEKALSLDSKLHFAITGVALIKAVIGEHEQGVKQIEDARKTFGKDPQYLYGCACVYSRSAGYLREHPEVENAKTKADEYEKKALADLDQTIKLGYKDYEWFKNDPDMRAIKETDQFKKLMIPAKPTKKPATTKKPVKNGEDAADDAGEGEAAAEAAEDVEVIEEVEEVIIDAPAQIFFNVEAEPIVKEVVFLPTPGN